MSSYLDPIKRAVAGRLPDEYVEAQVQQARIEPTGDALQIQSPSWTQTGSPAVTLDSFAEHIVMNAPESATRDAPSPLDGIKAQWAREAEAAKTQRDRLDKLLGVERDHPHTPAGLRRDRYAPATAQQSARARLGLPPS